MVQEVYAEVVKKVIKIPPRIVDRNPTHYKQGQVILSAFDLPYQRITFMIDSFDLSLRLAPKDQYTALYAIMALAGEHMHRVLRLSHWHPFFSSDRFIERLGERDAYGVYADDMLVGTFSLGPQPEPYYLDDMSEYWQVATEEADYFSTFALLPSYQQYGIGTWCMQQADQIARKAGYRWLRFDAVATHPKLLHFYSRLGYEQRGILDLGRAQVMCYEKDLSQAES